jgi:butyrate kinase
MHFVILAVNPGSTSTKMAVYRDEQLLSAHVLRHDTAALERFPGIWDQLDFRLDPIRTWAREHAPSVSAVAGIGGLLRPLRGGTYRVNTPMLEDARRNLQGEHPSNLGCALAHALAGEHRCEAFVIDPVSVDELEPLARFSGHPLIERRSLSHALSIHAAARRAAHECGLDPASATFVIAHLGGGISIAPVRGGRIIDVNDASSDGPFSPERTGGLPLQPFITLCRERTEAEIRRLVMGQGGITAYLGTNAALEVERRIGAGDERARIVYEAMAYQIAKEIGAMATVLSGNIQRIVLTGGLAGSAMLTGWIRQRVRSIAPVEVFPGEDEMLALAAGTLRVLRGEEPPLEYGEVP